MFHQVHNTANLKWVNGVAATTFKQYMVLKRSLVSKMYTKMEIVDRFESDTLA